MPEALTPILSAKTQAEVLECVKNSGSSFLLGMAALEPARRQGMFALYAFCRAVDDIADSDWPRDKIARELEIWRGYIRDVFKGQPRHPVMELLQPAIANYGLVESDFHDIIAGMEMDANGPIQRPDWQTLDLYCDRVASAVGRVSVRIFGEATEHGQQTAYHLGRALQLTNILRDIDEDAGRERLYMPFEALEEAGISSDRIDEIINHPAFDHAARAVARQAVFHFDEAEVEMQQCSRRAIKPARLMRDYYAKLMHHMLLLGWDSPRVRVGLGPLDKILLMLRFYLP